MVRVLLDRGSDIEARNSMKETAMILAAIYSTECTELLLERGAKVDVVDWSGHSPLSRAKEKLDFARSKGGLGNEKDLARRVAMLEKALQKSKAEGGKKEEADALREAGNEAFKKNDFRKAILLYTQSLDIMEDYRCYSNRAACHLKLKNIEQARDDAGITTNLAPTFVKGWYRSAKAHCANRDFARAKCHLEKGLEHVPNDPTLTEMLEKLQAMKVPSIYVNTMLGRGVKAIQRVEHGEKAAVCCFCHRPFPANEPDYYDGCPHCGCDPFSQLADQDVLDELAQV